MGLATKQVTYRSLKLGRGCTAHVWAGAKGERSFNPEKKGTPHSTPEKQEVEQPEAAAVVVHFRRLYADLTAPDDTGSPSDDKMFRVRNSPWPSYVRYGLAISSMA